MHYVFASSLFEIKKKLTNRFIQKCHLNKQYKEIPANIIFLLTKKETLIARNQNSVK